RPVSTQRVIASATSESMRRQEAAVPSAVHSVITRSAFVGGRWRRRTLGLSTGTPWRCWGRCQIIERLSLFDLPDTILADERVLVSASYLNARAARRSDESPSRRSRRAIP